MIILPVKNEGIINMAVEPGKIIHQLATNYVIAEVCNELGIKEHTIEGLQSANGKEIYVEYKYTDGKYKHLGLVYARIVIDEDEPEKYKETGKFFVGFETIFRRDRFSTPIEE